MLITKKYKHSVLLLYYNLIKQRDNVVYMLLCVQDIAAFYFNVFVCLFVLLFSVVAKSLIVNVLINNCHININRPILYPENVTALKDGFKSKILMQNCSSYLYIR